MTQQPSYSPFAGSVRYRSANSLRLLLVSDFSGGWNCRDAPSEVADNESPDLLNVTIDERGGAQKRLGISRLNSSQVNSSKLDNVFYSPTLQIAIAQQGAHLFKSTDVGATWTELQNNGATTPAFTDTGLVGFGEFLGKIVICNNGNTDKGIYTYDNTTAKISAKVTNSPPCNMCAVFQNRLFTSGDPAQPTRVTNTDPGALTYTTLGTTYNTNDFRTLSDAPVTALGGGEGIDIQARSGLYVWKEDSFYRVNNALTMAYDPISIEYGCSGPLALASAGGITSAISKHGIVIADSTDSKLVSQKIEPLFTPAQLKLSLMNRACAGIYRDRVVFSLPRGTSATTNNFMLEFHPIEGWIVPHSLGLAAMTTWGKNDEKLIGTSTTAGYGYEVFKSGADDSAAIASRYQTRWFVPNGDLELRMRRLRLVGRGDFNFYAKWNYTLGQGDRYQASIGSAGIGVWNSDTWDDGSVYGPASAEGFQDFNSIGHGRTIAFQVQETSSLSFSGPPLLLDGATPEIGAWALYSIQGTYVPLGVA